MLQPKTLTNDQWPVNTMNGWLRQELLQLSCATIADHHKRAVNTSWGVLVYKWPTLSCLSVLLCYWYCYCDVTKVHTVGLDAVTAFCDECVTLSLCVFLCVSVLLCLFLCYCVVWCVFLCYCVLWCDTVLKCVLVCYCFKAAWHITCNSNCLTCQLSSSATCNIKHIQRLSYMSNSAT